VFYLLSKLLDVLLTPLAWAVVLIGLGTWGRASSRKKHVLVASGLGMILLFSLEPISNALWRSLEEPPLRTYRPEVTYDVVILLGGMVEERVEGSWHERAFNDNNERLLQTYDLLREGKAKNVIVSGGGAPASSMQVVEARVLADQLIAWGIEPERVVVEDRARNTRENAVESAAIVRAHDWKSVLIVTSAFHMPRAHGCFRAVGLDVDAMPVDFRSFKSPYSSELVPRAEHLMQSSGALREWFGRGIYRLRGYSR